MPSWKTAAMTAMLAVCLCGCARGKRTVIAAPPPPPEPAVAKAPEGPLSIPQTSVHLPPPQPLDPKALETARQAPEPVEPQPPPAAKPKRPQQPPVAATGPQPPPESEAPPAAPQEERPRLQEIVPPEEKRRLAEEINVRKREINNVLQQAARSQLSDQDRAIVERIRSFLQLSDQAAARDDMRQAEALSERALLLARELRGAR